VTSYENFWLATAAAAPVIALAAAVALPDTSSIYREDFQQSLDEWFGTTTKLCAVLQAAGATEAVVKEASEMDLRSVMKEPLAKITLPLRVIAAGIRWTAVGNVVLQAVVLTFSLAALAYNVDVMPRWLAIILTVGGILLLAATVFMVSSYRRGASRGAKLLDEQMPGVVRDFFLTGSKDARGTD
jgi:hypothetical protein